MQNKRTKAELKFSGYQNSWESVRFHEVAEMFNNRRVPVTASERKAGKTAYYGANGIQDFVEGYTHEGDFVLIAEDGANDLINYPVRHVEGEIWVNNHAHVVSGISGLLDNNFLVNRIKAMNIAPHLVGGGRAKLNAEVLKKIIILIPEFEEQIKIGDFFRKIDDGIAFHQKELDALKQTKQGFLQKMFPNGEETLPAIRFNSFVETWKQNEFGKVIKLVGGATPLKENKEYWVGDIVWLSSQEIKNKYVSKGTYTISEKAVKDNRTKVVPLGTPLIVTRSGILAKRFPISISSNEVAINQDIKALIFDPTKIDTEFIVAQMKAQESYILNNIVKTGTTVQSVNLPDLNRMMLHIPQYEEQVKIGEFFRRMDEVIELKEKELEALKQTKQGFLQKMFV